MILLNKYHLLWEGSLRVLFTHGDELDVLYLCEQIFSLIVIIGFIGINDCTIWQLKGIILSCINITTAAMGQKTLDRLALFGHQQMNFQPREIPSLACRIASKLFIGIDLGSSNPSIIADGNRYTINHGDGISLQSFPDLSEQIAYTHKGFVQLMESATQPTLAQHMRDIAVLLQHGSRTFMIAAKK
jgi:hypothetical protein